MTELLAPWRWLELEPWLDEALERPLEERAAFVAQFAVSDPGMFTDLSALLRDAARVTELPLLDRSAGGVFSSLLREDAESVMQVLERALAGHYSIIRQEGAGGMATVYLAHDIRHDRQAALAMISIGKRDEALATLARIKPRGAWLWSYLIMPGLDPVRTDPRFVALVDEARPPGATKRR